MPSVGSLYKQFDSDRSRSKQFDDLMAFLKYSLKTFILKGKINRGQNNEILPSIQSLLQLCNRLSLEALFCVRIFEYMYMDLFGQCANLAINCMILAN